MFLNYKFYNYSKILCPPLVLISLYLLTGGHNPIGGLDTAHASVNSDSNRLEDFNFVSAGDFGCSERANRTIAGMVSKNPEIIIATGDLSYERKPDCWFSLISPLDTGNKFTITIGEHDIGDGPAKYQQYLEHFNLTRPFYSFDYQNVHFLVMATAKNRLVPYMNDSEQFEFVRQDLKKAHSNKSIDWIVVSTFRPFYSSNTTHPGLDKLQDTYHRLFEKYDVDIVLQGHNHNYQRTYPVLFNEDRPPTASITDSSEEKYNDVKGQIFFTVGTGGQDLYNITGQAPFVAEQFLHHGFLNVDITENGSKLTAIFYENIEMTEMDKITIKKKLKNE